MIEMKSWKQSIQDVISCRSSYVIIVHALIGSSFVIFRGEIEIMVEVLFRSFEMVGSHIRERD
jgi:hypothetical protein